MEVLSVFYFDSYDYDKFFELLTVTTHVSPWIRDHAVLDKFVEYYKEAHKNSPEMMNATRFMKWCLLLFPHQWKEILDTNPIRIWKF